MIRLFLGITSFLAVSVSGLWYGFFADPLTEASFENASFETEHGSEEEMLENKTEVEGVANPDPTPAPMMSPSAELVDSWTNTVPPENSPPPAPVPSTEPAKSLGLSIESRLIRFGYRLPPTPRTTDTIVLHSSYNASGGDLYDLDKTIAQYETYGVGAHYIIDRKAVIYRLVDEANIAYHAGSSKMTDGRKNVNDFSIGIEIIATEDSGYTEKQYIAVNDLIDEIKTRHKIKTVVGHGDIAPGRKTDPWKFDWKKLK